ncbi:STAS-like domain-containing protein [Burkholderia cenocepacia]|uniref:STAS-like domain-containing protein n=1 Tax=Burkholderia cenocepacia TaxID=95486 RepID=UPI001FB70FBC|nr:STAS-like domain-containing protein [Burkholderia cenocepacia]MDR5647935.1 STAS-like domain-containing protein [Burkholderia cenocepacia]
MMITIRVAQDFSRHPAGRFRSDGPYSGELFREKFLTPALRAGERLRVILDGARGYGSSFLEEAFGGLVRKEGFARDMVERSLDIESADSSLKAEILEYIHEAVPESKGD